MYHPSFSHFLTSNPVSPSTTVRSPTSTRSTCDPGDPLLSAATKSEMFASEPCASPATRSSGVLRTQPLMARRLATWLVKALRGG